MNDLQKAEYEILCAFVHVCEELKLTYYLVCGSALGAVKYRGFIPWDDDIDVAMFRADYERFLCEAPERLPRHLFIQTFKTDPNFPQIYAKLRNSQTTYLESTAEALTINHGIFIDIFPLDYYPNGHFRQNILELKKREYRRRLAYTYNVPRRGLSRILCAIYHAVGLVKNTQQIAQNYERAVYGAFKNSDIVCNHGNWQGRLEYAPREQYGEGTWAEFEGLKVRIPEKYDEYLTQKYGDWRADPPIEEQVGHHYYTICDCNTPYTDYIKKDRKIGNSIPPTQ